MKLERRLQSLEHDHASARKSDSWVFFWKHRDGGVGTAFGLGINATREDGESETLFRRRVEQQRGATTARG